MRADQELMDKMLAQGDHSKLIVGQAAAKAIDDRAFEAEKKRNEERRLRKKRYFSKSDEEKYNDFLEIFNEVTEQRKTGEE